MKKLFLCGVVSSLAALYALDTRYPNRIYWNSSSSKEGYFTEPSSWQGGVVPGAGQTAAVIDDGNDNRGHYVIKFPQGVTTVNSLMYFATQHRDSSITIDTTEGALYHFPSTIVQDWTGFGFQIYDTNHYFNFESNQQGKPICWFNGGTMKAWTDETSTQHVDIESGNLNWATPNGVPSSSCLVLSRTAVITAKEGSSLDAGTIKLRNGTFQIEGGNHTFHRDFYVGEGFDDVKPVYIQTGGKVHQASGNTSVGAVSNTENTFKLSGNAEYTQPQNSFFWVGKNRGSTVHFEMGSNASATLGSFVMSYEHGENIDDGTSAYALLKDSAILKTQGESTIGLEMLKETPSLNIVNNAIFESGYVLNVGYANQGKGVINLADNAILHSKSFLRVYDGSSINVEGQAKILAEENTVTINKGGSVSLAENAKFESMESVVVDGGVLTFADNASFMMNTNNGGACFLYLSQGGNIELNGGDSFLSCIHLNDVNGIETKFKVTKGNHTLIRDPENRNNVPLTVGNDNGKNIFEMTGGTFSVPRMGRVGFGNTGTGSAIFRLSGGEFEINTSAVSEAVFNVCDSTDSKARVELLGGKLRCQYIRGWTGAQVKGGRGWAALYANGGALSPNILTVNALITTFDEAVLGENGLILDTEGRNTSIAQAFVDEENKQGLFKKVGEGVLTVSTESQHSKTVVSEGEIYFAVPKFGKNIEVVDNASISTVGGASSIEVESLTLGSDTSVGYLKIDSGDMITITGGSNGFNPVNAVIICDAMSGVGEYPIFNLTGEVDTDDLAEKLSKVKYSNSNKSYSFDFVPVATENGCSVKLKVAQRTSVGATWRGSGNDWAAEGSWEGEVPGAATIAIFPQDAANKAVSINDTAQAFEAKIMGGEYEFNGNGMLTLDKITVSGGKLNVNVAQKPNMGIEVDVASGSSLTFTQPLQSVSDLDKFVKFGDGLLTLGALPNWRGAWAFNGGKTIVDKPSALGQAGNIDTTVSMGYGTLNFAIESSQSEIEIPKKLEINSGATQPAVIDVEKSSVKFTKGVNAVSGGFIKKGSKDLTIEIPQGTTSITASNLGKGFALTAETIEFDGETGLPPVASPDANAPYGGLTVVEGKLSLRGAGADKTLLNQKHALLVGGCTSSVNPATLEVSGMTMNQGDSGIHCFVAGTKKSTLRIIDGAVFNSDTINLATKSYGGISDVAENIVEVKNAKAVFSWVLNLGLHNNVTHKGVFDIGEGGILEVESTCINVNGFIGGTVADGGILRANGSSGNEESKRGFYINDGGLGELNFVDGGVLDVKCVSSSSGGGLLSLNFNGGIFKVRETGSVSMSSHVEKRTLNALEKGMYVDVADAASRHTIAMPINGNGGIVKTGNGDLFIAKCIQVSGTATQVEDVFTANCKGASSVKAGSLTLEAGAARTDFKVAVESGAELRISGDQALGVVSGAGKITSGNLTSNPEGFNNGEFVVVNENAGKATLTAKIAHDLSKNADVEDVPLFENINLSNIVVDYAMESSEDFVLDNTKIPVARIGEGVTVDPAAWRVQNRPALIVVTHTLENGVVYANLAREGFILLLK